MHNQNQITTVSRGLLPIYYSSTSGMSKDIANQFQSKVQEIGFIAPVMNVGDIDFEEFLQYQGPAAFFLSTYGNGDSPHDGQTFLTWVEGLKKNNELKNLSFIIFALGNSTFQHFCGFGRKTTQAFLNNGAKMLVQTKKCDANSSTENASSVFPKWSQNVLNILTLNYQLKEISVSALTGGFHTQITELSEDSNIFDWQSQYKLKNSLENGSINLGRQFNAYLNSHKAQVIFIKELRNFKGESNMEGRSTLWLRIKTPQRMQLWPGCNINIYPQNIIEKDENQKRKLIKFTSQSKSKRIPYPPMLLSDLKTLLNVRQKPSNKIIKNAILLSQKSAQAKDKYYKIISQGKIQEEYLKGMTCQTLIKQLQPAYEFYADLGINLPRAYTLASWKNHTQYFDLCISTVKNGLTCNYLKSMPKYLRINSFQSTFSIPDNGKPLSMIANGSGIAPFRSIIQYFSQKPVQERVPLRLYYGIQNKQIDYYFSSQLEEYRASGIVQIFIAQSRKDPTKKLYIQEIVESHKAQFQEHLFRKEGGIFVCGGKQMSKAVNAALFKAITLECKMAYKGFTIMNGLKAKRVIVEEVFG